MAGGCNYGTKRGLGLSVYYMIGQGKSVIGQGKSVNYGKKQ